MTNKPITKRQEPDDRQQSILREIEQLQRSPTAEIRQRWVTLMGSEPKQLGRNYLIRRLAYRLQELAFGGLSREARAQLSAKPKKQPARLRASKLKPGTRLVRQWHGRRYEVVVLENGFSYEGQEYRSLSAVARAITGSYWSGNRFFGLTPRKK